MRAVVRQSWRRIAWVFRDPLPIASAAALCLASLLAYRVPHWIAKLPPTYGWWYAVRHEDYPPDLLLMSVLLALLVPACLFAWGERLVDRIRYGSDFVSSYTPSPRRKHQIVERARANLCPACGYDVRHSSLVCPECGGPIRRLLAIPPRRAARSAAAKTISVRVRRRAS